MLWTRYWVTDAVGLHELLMLCELAKSLPQLSVYTGYSMGAQYIPLNMSQQFALDALDMVEYTTGLCDTHLSLSIYLLHAYCPSLSHTSHLQACCSRTLTHCLFLLTQTHCLFLLTQTHCLFLLTQTHSLTHHTACLTRCPTHFPQHSDCIDLTWFVSLCQVM